MSKNPLRRVIAIYDDPETGKPVERLECGHVVKNEYENCEFALAEASREMARLVKRNIRPRRRCFECGRENSNG
jgi:DNA-directed RNA polymerase subunit N (RpoN/RPB10)